MMRREHPESWAIILEQDVMPVPNVGIYLQAAFNFAADNPLQVLCMNMCSDFNAYENHGIQRASCILGKEDQVTFYSYPRVSRDKEWPLHASYGLKMCCLSPPPCHCLCETTVDLQAYEMCIFRTLMNHGPVHDEAHLKRVICVSPNAAEHFVNWQVFPRIRALLCGFQPPSDALHLGDA